MLAYPNDIHLKKGNELKEKKKRRSKFCIPQSRSTLETPVMGRVSGSWRRVINGKSFKVWGDQRCGRGLASVYECGGQPKRPQGSQEGIHSSTRHTSASANSPLHPSPHLTSPPQKMSWTNANRPAPSSPAIPYESGAYRLQKAPCFHAPILIVFPARRPVARGRSRQPSLAPARTCNACKWEERHSKLDFRRGSKRTHSSMAKKCFGFFFQFEEFFRVASSHM